MHSREDVINTIQMLGVKYPVENWNYKGVNYWPLIINIVFFEFHRRHLTQANDVLKKGKSDSILSLFRSITKLKPIKLGDNEVLFLGNRLQNIDPNPESPNRWYLLDYKLLDSRKIKHIYYEADKIYKGLRVLRIASNPDSSLKAGIDSSWQSGFDQFILEVNTSLNINIAKSKLLSYILQTYMLSQKYTRVLKKSKLRSIFVAPYYHVVGYAMMIAARELGIPTVDVQHGGQGKLHIAYSTFDQPPTNGYKLLPKYFWCWDSASYDNIKKWTTKQNFHVPKVLGNPWLIYYSSFISKPIIKSNDKKVILYTLQPELSTDLIMNAIKKSGDEYLWWIRCHPKDTSMRAALIKEAEKLGISDNVEIERASTAPLPELIESCDLHISRFSGSILEAADMGVYSIIIDPIGVNTFGDLIDDGLAFEYLGDSETELLDLIDEVLSKETMGDRIDKNAVSIIEAFLDELGLSNSN